MQDTLKAVVGRSNEFQTTTSDKIDRVLAHRWWGLVVFIGIMFLLFQMLFTDFGFISLNGLVEAGIEWLTGAVELFIPHGTLRSLVCDGVIAGVGGVLPLSTDCYAFLSNRDYGRLWVYGSRRVGYGSLDDQSGAKRQSIFAFNDFVWLCRSWDHVDANHRKLARSTCYDFDRSPHELLSRVYPSTRCSLRPLFRFKNM